MANELLSILSGFMQGYSGTKNANRDRDEKKIMADLQKQKMQIDLENAKQRSQFINLITQQMQQQNTQATTGQPSTGPAEAKKPDILDTLAKYTPQSSESQMPSPQAQGQNAFRQSLQDPKFLTAAKVSGIDLSGIANSISSRDRLTETQKHNADLKTQAEARLLESQRATNMADEDRDRVPLSELVNFRDDKGNMPQPGIKYQELSSKKWRRIPQPQSIEGATKSQGMRAALRGIRKVRNIIFNDDGTVNRTKLAQYRPIPFIAQSLPDIVVRAFSNEPPVGQQIQTMLAQGFESLIRGESGAAVPPEELVRLAKRYGIDWTQDDKTIRLRLDTLESILSGTVRVVDPKDIGAFDPSDVTYRVLPDGNKEYLLLPTAFPAPNNSKFEILSVD